MKNIVYRWVWRASWRMPSFKTMEETEGGREGGKDGGAMQGGKRRAKFPHGVSPFAFPLSGQCLSPFRKNFVHTGRECQESSFTSLLQGGTGSMNSQKKKGKDPSHSGQRTSALPFLSLASYSLPFLLQLPAFPSIIHSPFPSIMRHVRIRRVGIKPKCNSHQEVSSHQHHSLEPIALSIIHRPDHDQHRERQNDSFKRFEV
mmetsp:Transcript_26324/g.51752  ORF Transcript_26324/g.51752 Transcript_26324/m.51752 type:complete len:202 (-) Transcript_26324:351-956(-)